MGCSFLSIEGVDVYMAGQVLLGVESAILLQFT